MYSIAHGNGTVAGIARETVYALQSGPARGRARGRRPRDGRPDPADRRRQTITLTAERSSLLDDMEAERWSKRFVQKLGMDNIRQTIEHLRELKDVLDADADAEHLEADKRRRSET